MNMVYYLLLGLFFFSDLFGQDSLYLINSLTGETHNRLREAKAAVDLNGDGYADLAVLFEDSTRIYFGNPNFELTTFLSMPLVLSFPGDVNNDGFGDFIFFKDNNIYLGFGGQQFDTTGILVYEPQYWDESFSRQVDPVGDINGDGYNDFVISSPYNWSDGISRVYLYYGGETISSEPAVVFTSGVSHSYVDFFGHAVTGIGDQNNDGYDDFLISAPNEPFVDSMVSKVYLYYGSTEIESSADSILKFTDKEFGFNLKNLGDINNDGIIDFAITSQANCIVYFEFKKIMTTYFYGTGHGLGGNGDLNNDGIMDIIIGDPSYKDELNYIGCINTYLGESEFSFISDYFNLGEQYFSNYSQYVDFVGDFNNDGYVDIFVIANTFREDSKEIGKLYLYSIKKVSGFNESNKELINDFILLENYPNPFNSTTNIKFWLKESNDFNIMIYDIGGKLIKTLFKGIKQSGIHEVLFDGSDLPSGVYFYRLSTEHYTATRRMLLIK